MTDRSRRERFRMAAVNTMLAAGDAPFAVEGGYRMAATVLGDPVAWLCPHAHPSPEAARACLTDAGCRHAAHYSDQLVEECLRARGFTFPVA